MKEFSNLATVVYRRTYSRNDTGTQENWNDTVERAIYGNVKGHNVPEKEIKDLLRLAKERKAGPAGRGYWFSGAPAHSKIGGAALTNCWFFTSDDWYNYVLAQDLLMLGGGVGFSVEHKYSSKLPRIKKDVCIEHKATKDAEFIVPDSREGWCELTRRILEAYFVTGRSFSYSTICVRGAGELIKGFGGVSSGPTTITQFVETVSEILNSRAGKYLNPIDASDILTAIAAMVVAGNVRRSAILILGDCWDKNFLKIKRWDIATIPSHRANANYSVIVEAMEDLHPLFWKTYEFGEAIGLVVRDNIQKYGRMGELKKDKAVGVNPCVPAGTEVLTTGGYRPIEELVGNSVEIWNGGEWSNVTPKITGYSQPLLTVVLSSGQSLTCTPEHKFIKALDYKGSIERCCAKNLQIGDKLIKNTYPTLKDGLDVHYAYTQGFIAAEGMDNYPYFYVYDEKIMCLSRMNLSHVGNHNGNRVSVRPSFDKYPKSFVPLKWSCKCKLDWLAGLCDGDGTVLAEGGIQIGSINFKFLLETQKLLTTVGCPSKLSADNREGLRSLPDGKGGHKDYYCKDLFRLCIGSQDVQNLVQLGFHCERLQIEGFTPNRSAERFPFVVSITDSGIADVVYCFTEEKRHQGCFEGIITGNCGEATLENGEPCNLTETALCNIEDSDEFVYASKLMHRYAKRVTLETYHHKVCDEVIKRNRRVGGGITGCLASPLFNPKDLDRAYQAIQEENISYSKELNIPPSIRTTVVKPSGTMSKVLDCMGYEGIHAPISRYMVQRIRFASNDPAIPKLKEAGHYMEPVVKFDGSIDHGTMVVDFYVQAPEGFPVIDEGFTTWKQLDTLLMAQKYWADQAVSCTVYYKKEEIPQLKEWLSNNLQYLKTISFLLETEHGFKQAPKEAITEDQYGKLSSKIKLLSEDAIEIGELESQECAGGQCPIK